MVMGVRSAARCPPLLDAVPPMLHRYPGFTTPFCKSASPQTLVDPERRIYNVSSEMSIEFEVDGPYKVGPGMGSDDLSISLTLRAVVPIGPRQAQR